MGRDRTQLSQGASHRKKFQRGTLLPSQPRDGSSNGDRQSHLHRESCGEEKDLGCKNLRLRSRAILSRRPPVKRLRPDANNPSPRRTNLTARNDDQQNPRNLAPLAKVTPPRYCSPSPRGRPLYTLHTTTSARVASRN